MASQVSYGSHLRRVVSEWRCRGSAGAIVGVVGLEEGPLSWNSTRRGVGGNENRVDVIRFPK